MKQKVKFIAIILVYRNSDDLRECIQSFQYKVNECKIVVVNAYYDYESMQKIETITKEYGCDFINIENKGYSYGNNCGINYAKENFDFEYVIISNPDIIINKFEEIDILNADIIAPHIATESGKNQNPMQVYESKVAEWLIYHGFISEHKLLLYAGIGIYKVARTIVVPVMNMIGQTSYEIYAAHGSFVILSLKTIAKLGQVYDENMFLFAEEGVLAFKSKKFYLKTVYTKSIDITHKEDGSVKLNDFSINDEVKKANIYYYENYRKVKK